MYRKKYSLKRSIQFLLLFFISLNLYSQDEVKVSDEVLSIEESFANAKREMYVGKIDKAITMFEDMYKQDRSNASIAFELFKAYSEKKDFALMEKYSNNVLENAPKNKFMLEAIANVYTDNNKHFIAENFLKKLISLGGNDAQYYEQLIIAQTKQLKYDDAIKTVNQNIGKNGFSLSIGLKKYELFALAKKENEAIKTLDSLIIKYPSNIKILKEKVNYLSSKGDDEKVMEVYKKILALDPEDTQANLALLSKGEKKDKPNAYLMSLVPIITNPTIDIDVKIKELIPYVNTLARGGNQDVKNSLQELANKLVLTHPTEAKAYAIHGDILLLNGNTEEAAIKYEKTISLNNKNFVVWDQLMGIYLENQQYENLSKLSTKAIDLYPNEGLSFFYDAMAKLAKNDTKGVNSSIEEGILVSGGNVIKTSKIEAVQALLNIKEKAFDKAQSTITKLISLNPKDAFFREVEGNLFESMGNLSKAKESWSLAKNLGSRSKSLQQKLQ